MPSHREDRKSDDSIEELIVECLENASENRTEAVERLCAEHPEKAAELRERFAMLADAGLLEESGAADSEAADSGDAGEPGQFGPFRLLRQLGRGGMGVVYLAEQPSLHRRVALKLIRRDYLEHPRARARFQREVEAASSLDHPGICTVYEAGEEDDTPYIAMRYLPGETLSQRLNHLREQTPLDEGGGETTATPSSRTEIFAAVAMIEKVARALHHAHETGLIHRDVKPGNIMLGENEEPVLLDFGLARPEAHTGESLTVSGDFLGTPAYMAPEQIASEGRSLDRRADVYSLGVTLFECLTLRLPFEAPTREELYRVILSGGTTDASRFNRAIPRDLLVVIATAMESDPQRRYESALEFAEDLRRVRTLQPIAARRPGVAGRAWRWAQREPLKAAISALLILGIPAVAGLSGYILATENETSVGAEALRLSRYDDALTRGLTTLDEFGGGPHAHAEALGFFEEALALQPGSIEAELGRALALYYKGDAAEAVTQLQALGHPELRVFEAWLLRTMDRDAEADRLMRDLPPPRTSRELFVAGLTMVLHGDLAANRAGRQSHLPGREQFRTGHELLHRALLTAARPSLAYHYEYFHAVYHLMDPKRIREAVAACEALWPGHAATLFAILSGLNTIEPERAIAAGKELMARGIEFENLYHNLGRAYRAIGDPRAAITPLRQAIAAHPDWTSLYPELARIHLSVGELAAAERLCREAIERDEDEADALGTLAQILIDRNDLDEGIAHAKRALQLAPETLGGMVNLGIGLGKLGQHEEAIDLLRQAARLAREAPARECDRVLPIALTQLGFTLSLAGRLPEAEEVYRKATRLQPPAANAFFHLGILHQKRGETQSAVEAYQQAVSLAPELPGARCNLAWQLLAQSYASKALGHMRIGHELGSKRGWQHPSAEWVEYAEKAAKMEAKLMPLVDGKDGGKDDDADVTTVLAAAQLAEKRGRDDDAARLYARAFAAEPARLEETQPRRRLPASRAAARAAGNTGLDAERQRELRRQCLGWLRSEFAASQKRAAGKDRSMLERTRDELSQWLQEDDYADLRNASVLAGLPVAEQVEWQRFWASVRSLLADTLTRLE